MNLNPDTWGWGGYIYIYIYIKPKIQDWPTLVQIDRLHDNLRKYKKSIIDIMFHKKKLKK
jgi:hypothetical protein